MLYFLYYVLGVTLKKRTMLFHSEMDIPYMYAGQFANKTRLQPSIRRFNFSGGDSAVGVALRTRGGVNENVISWVMALMFNCI